MFSIIIPVKRINDYIREALSYYAELDEGQDFEILIFPDEVTDEERTEIAAMAVGDKVRIIPSGETGPAEKRDMSMEYAKGDIFAFIDDDAYPRHDWLTNAAKILEDDNVGGVGGPAVTAPNDRMRQLISGKAYESFMCSAGYTYRYFPAHRREVNDLPSVNLIIKRNVFEAVGGYDSGFYPGEDTKLCLDIVENTGKKIIYDPSVLVYHHRRTIFREHLRQAIGYGKHRGYFAKTLPKTSFKIQYFLPTLFVIGLVGGFVLCFHHPIIRKIYFIILAIYALLVTISIKKPKNPIVLLLTFITIFLTHVGYGVNFIRGLLARHLPR